MSLLNIDDVFIDLAGKVEFVKSPIVDMKNFDECDIAIVEGAVADEDDLRELKEMREKSETLIALGDCAVFGGMTAFRNLFEKDEVLRRGYVETETTKKGRIPKGKDVPGLLDQAEPLGAHVKVDLYIPGCPPDAESISFVLMNLIEGKMASLPPKMIHFDSKRRLRRT